MAHKSYKEFSKENWGFDPETSIHGKTPDNAQLQVGALMRIADATEKMASSYTSLQNDRDMYKRWYQEGNVRNQKMARRIAALQGVITKMKKAI